MTTPTLEDAARAIIDRHSNIAAAERERMHELLLDHNMAIARAVLLSIRPPDREDLPLRQLEARDYIDGVLKG